MIFEPCLNVNYFVQLGPIKKTRLGSMFELSKTFELLLYDRLPSIALYQVRYEVSAFKCETLDQITVG